jgi:uncharacterized membrane protein YraQ (UPF0718 family)
MGDTMKAYLQKNLISLVIFLLFCLFIILSFILPIQAGLVIKDNFIQSAVEMIGFIPLVFILIGLLDVWLPREKIEKHIGKTAGLKGIIWVILLAMFQVGPLYSAFPVAYLLWKKGAGTRNVFIYLGAFSTMKIPMLTFETGFLGLKFTLLRTLISLPVFMVIAFILEIYLKNKNF